MEKYNLTATITVNSTVRNYLETKSLLKSSLAAGCTFPAKEVLCAILPFVLTGLDALMALATKWFLRWAISVVRTAIEVFGNSICLQK